MINGFSWVGIRTENIEETIQFFIDGLGLSMAERNDEYGVAQLRLPNGQIFEIMGRGNQFYDLHQQPVIAFDVDNIEQARMELEEKGAIFTTETFRLSPDSDEAWCYLRDNNGHIYELYQHSHAVSQHENGFSWMGIRTDDKEGTLSFYRDVLGLFIPRRNDECQTIAFSFPSGQEMEAFWQGSTFYDLHAHPVIAFDVDDICVARQKLEAKGTELLTDIFHASSGPIGEESAWCYFRDPNGYIHELHQQQDKQT